MGRVIFSGQDQTDFFRSIVTKSGLNSEELGPLCNVSPRTFRDWQRGKFSIPENALLILVKKFSLALPENIIKVDDYWCATKGARKGALRRLELYGSLGTFEGRIKGGKISQLRRKENPEKYRLLGCNVRKDFKIDEFSIDFAEAAGIILGDGAITYCQTKIFLSSIVDRPYAEFVRLLFERVFGERPSLRERYEKHTLVLFLSGVGLVEELKRNDFTIGNKVRQQVGFPSWVWTNLEFQKACVRGLMDTDGGCYFHKHKTSGLVYGNFGMCFTNKSFPIVQSFAKVLKSVGLKFYLVNGGTQIDIYSFKEIKKYFEIIGSHNQKNIDKYNYYLGQQSHRVAVDEVGCESPVESAVLERPNGRKVIVGSNPTPTAEA